MGKPRAGRNDNPRWMGLPVWIWYLGAVGSLIFAGKIYEHLPKAKQPYSTNDLLDLSKLLARIAKTAEKTDYDKMEQVKTILHSINELDRLVDDDVDPNNMLDFKKQMRDAAAVIRGTIKSRIEKESILSEPEIAELMGMGSERATYTFDQTEYWEQTYEKSGLKSPDWYLRSDAELLPYAIEDAMSWPIRPTNISDDHPSQQNITRNLTSLNDFFGPLGPLNLPKDAKMLHLGCGSSPMANNLTDLHGFSNIVSVDIVESLINLMKAEYPKLQFEVQNGEALTYADGEFDVVFEKGTIDALDNNSTKHTAVLREVRRVLRGSSTVNLDKPKWFIQVSTKAVGGADLVEHYGPDCQELILLRKDGQDTKPGEIPIFNLLHVCKF